VKRIASSSVRRDTASATRAASGSDALQKGRLRTAGARQPWPDGAALASRHRPVASCRSAPQLPLAGEGTKEKTAVGAPCVLERTTWEWRRRRWERQQRMGVCRG